MRAASLRWRTVTQSNHPKFMVKGTELSLAVVPDTRSRFVVCEIRSYDAEGYADRVYSVRDAHTVSDEEVKQNVRPRVVQTYATIEEVLAFCKKEME